MLADRRRVILQEGIARLPPGIAQPFQKSPFGIELGGIAKVHHHIIAHHMQPHARPGGTFAIARIGNLAEQRQQFEFLQRHRVEGDFVHAIQNIPRGARHVGSVDRVDRNQDGVV